MEAKDRFLLFKEFYFKERDRRYTLNNEINVPVLVITAIISVNVYFFTKGFNSDFKIIFYVFSTIVALSLISAIFYLGKSYISFPYGYEYIEVKGMQEYLDYYKYKNDIDNGTIKIENEKSYPEFDEVIETNIVAAAESYYKINKERSLNLYYSKNLVFFSILITIILSVFYILTLK